MDMEFLGDSTCIDSAGYEGGYLTIQFTDGTVYTYTDVDLYTWRGLKTSTSKGYFFNKNIRNSFPFIHGTAPDANLNTRLYDLLEKTLQTAEYFIE